MPVRNSKNLIAILLGAFLLLAAGAFADDYIPPDQVKIKTPVYRPSHQDFDPPLGTYTYTVSWEGIPAAEATITVEQDGLRYRLTTTARTYSGIDWVYKLRYWAQGLISSVDFQPIKSEIRQQENSKKKTIEITFHENEIQSVRQTNGKEPEEISFNRDNFTLDPFSAAFLARGLEWEKGDVKEFDTFNGKSRYLITLTAEDKVKMDVNGEEKEVWVVVPTVQNLTYQKTGEKLRSAKIYVTADKAREVVKIRSSVFIGSVVTSLDSFEPGKTAAVVASNVTGKSDIF